MQGPDWPASVVGAIREGAAVVGSGGSLHAHNAAAVGMLGDPGDPDARERWRLLAECGRSNLGARGPQRLDLPEGSPVPEMVVRAAPLGEDGIRFLVVFDDSRRERRAAVEARLASRMQSLSSLVRTTLHDLRAPMNSIVLNLDLLHGSLGEAGAELDRELRYVEVVRDEVSRMNRILQGFLNQTRPPKSGRRRVDVRRVLREIASLVEPQAEAAGVRLDLDLSRVPAPVLASRDQLKEALLNIVLNALEVLSPGGRIAIRQTTEADRIRVAISDDGPGVPVHRRERIFEQHVSSKPEGSGLGLFVTRSLVAEIGGTVHVEDAEEGGARFVVVLPPAAREEPCGPS